MFLKKHLFRNIFKKYIQEISFQICSIGIIHIHILSKYCTVPFPREIRKKKSVRGNHSKTKCMFTCVHQSSLKRTQRPPSKYRLLSNPEDIISGPLNRGGRADLLLLKKHKSRFWEVLQSQELFCNNYESVWISL